MDSLNVQESIMRRGQYLLILVGVVAALVACANPLNRATFFRYRDVGIQAETRGNWATAEIAYARAANNVLWGNLGQELEAEALFNLGRAKRKVGKIEESADLLKRVMAIDQQLEKRRPGHEFLSSYTLMELATTHLLAKHYDEGIPLLVRFELISMKYKQQYADQARTFFKRVFEMYADDLFKLGRFHEAEHFKNVAASF